MPGIALSPSTTRSRRARNSRTIASTSSCGPRSASTAPYCEKLETLLTELMRSRPNAKDSHSGTIA